MITVVLVNWNGWADTIACLQSLLNCSAVPARVIVVDNHSSDESVDILQRWGEHGLELVPRDGAIEQHALRGGACPRLLNFVHYDDTRQRFGEVDHQLPPPTQAAIPIHVVTCGRNGGFGYGCNVGMKLGQLLGTDVFWLLNNDCVVPPEALALVNADALQHPRTILGTILKYYHEPDRIQAVGGGTFSRLTGGVTTLQRLSPERRLDFINGASMVFHAHCLEEVGGFDERIFMYFEENDFCMRAAGLGYRFDVVATDVFHKHGGSQGSRPSVKAWTQVLLNKHYVLRKNLGPGPWILFFFGMLVVRSILPLRDSVQGHAARHVLRSLITRACAR